ncbi:MAG: winged helix-turn-helix transcriptional regulator [Candidatus Njordarchaeales archaeon]
MIRTPGDEISLDKEMIKKLEVDERKLAQKLIDDISSFGGFIRLAHDIVRLEIKENARRKLAKKDLILIYLILKKLGAIAEYWPESYVTCEEVSKELGIKDQVVRARIAELMRDGYIRKIDRGKYEAVIGINTVSKISVLRQRIKGLKESDQ